MLRSITIPEVQTDDPVDDVLKEHVHSLTTVRADPHAASHAAQFDALVIDWTETQSVRVTLVIAVAQALANAFRIDAQLNAIVDDVVDALKKLPDNDLKASLQHSLLKGQPASIFKRPILANQLTAMTVWPSTLKGSGIPALEDIEKTLTPLLPIATAAQTGVSQAKQDLTDWKTIGRWKQHVVQANATRAIAYGDLLEVPHKNPAAGLPSDYAEQFFLHDTSRRGATKAKTSKQIAEEIDALKFKLNELTKEHTEALAREAAEAEELAALEQKQKELAALKEQEKETKARQKQLEKDLKKKTS
jgi:hypothetical protein